MIPIASHEREHERTDPSNIPDKQLGHDAPDPCYAERESGARNRRDLEDEETVAEQPPNAPPEIISDDDRIDEDIHDTVQLGRSTSECRRPDGTLSRVDPY